MSISTELRQQVEDLALKAVVAEDPCGSEAQMAEWIAALGRLQETAVRGNAAEVVDGAGHLFDPYSESEIARAMVDLIADPELRNWCHHNMGESVNRHVDVVRMCHLRAFYERRADNQSDG